MPQRAWESGTHSSSPSFSPLIPSASNPVVPRLAGVFTMACFDGGLTAQVCCKSQTAKGSWKVFHLLSSRIHFVPTAVLKK